MASLVRPTPVRPRAVESSGEVAIGGGDELKDADKAAGGVEGLAGASEECLGQSEGGPEAAQPQQLAPPPTSSSSSANIPSLAAPVPAHASTHSSPRALHTRPIPVPPRRTLSAPAPITPFRPRPLSRASKSPSFTPPDSALEELLEIFSSSPSLSAGGTPHRASSESARTILLPSRASGVRSRGPGYGRESAGHAHGHGRKRSSGEGLGAGTVGGAQGGRRTPPIVWFDGVAYSPPSRALTRNPFIRHAQSAIPIVHVPHGESPESEGSVLAI
ncbi:hypothetical protein NBRC10512_000400 [Rhodotorula toruloides]|uniref:RHTO0S26e00210g1_1 n=2 Tax=Rhodotorula toruloides TaxID=5286 RepID=A0A061BIZ3_RHOTO|nr:uncharacterized protein RHTO_01818 [Rhodotorula toruloides NP11]EMS21352.1 hypothetical protein RHTO_01818 [Rhodotorula toruloides NP11]CDR49362.1 RHTO0S26e00210g1_1 [Rhodotorula toruloides]